MKQYPKFDTSFMWGKPGRYQVPQPGQFDDTLTQLQKMNKLDSHIGYLDHKMFETVTHVDSVSHITSQNIKDIEQDVFEFKEDTTKEIETFEENMRESYMPISVGITLDEWLDNGKLAEVINEQVFTTINEKVDSVIYLSNYAKGDGTNETAAIQQAINDAYGKKLIWQTPITKFVVNRLNFNNIVVEFQPNVLIEAADNFTTHENIFRISDAENVKFIGNYATLDMKRTLYVDGEQRHAIAIFGGKNIEISNLNILNVPGDGIMMTASLNDPSFGNKNVYINNCLIDNAKRVGISITGDSENVVIDGVEISNTNGGTVEGAIDIEPNEGAGANIDIVIKNSTFKNNFRGVIVLDDSRNFDILNNKFVDSAGVSVTRIKVDRMKPTGKIRGNEFITTGATWQVSAVYIDGADFIEVYENTIDGFRQGIYTSNSYPGRTAKPIVRNNKINNVNTGVNIENTENADVYGNSITNSLQAPIKTTNAIDIRIYENSIEQYLNYITFTTTTGVAFNRNKMRRGTSNVLTAVVAAVTSSKVSFDGNDFKDAAMNNAIYSESTSVSYGFNVDIDGFNKPFLSEYNPAITLSSLGQLWLRNVGGSTKLHTAIQKQNNPYTVNIPVTYRLAAVPTTGYYVEGEIIEITNPLPGGYLYYRVMSTGDASEITFKGFAKLEE